MGLNKLTAKSNMYGFIDATFNILKGKCSHNCEYCYCKRWGEQKPLRFDEKELKTDLGENNYIFVGSSTDMFAKDVPSSWILEILTHIGKYPKNKYLFQTKNPWRFVEFLTMFPFNTVLCVTLESNIEHKISKAPKIRERLEAFKHLKSEEVMLTIEPIMKFDLKEFVGMIKEIAPTQVNIGADSKSHNLPEPTWEEVQELIKELEKFTKVFQKDNLKRLQQSSLKTEVLWKNKIGL